jgi:hypothetical protein
MALFGPSRAEVLEQELCREQDERKLLLNYVRNLEKICSTSDVEHRVQELQAAHQAAREEALRDLDGTVNFSLRPNFQRYSLGMLSNHFEVFIAGPNKRPY